MQVFVSRIFFSGVIFTENITHFDNSEGTRAEVNRVKLESLAILSHVTNQGSPSTSSQLPSSIGDYSEDILMM